MASASAETPDDPAGLENSALARLQAVVERIGRVVVAFSGGADSALVAAVATRLLGAGQVLCATAVSPSLAPEDLAHCSRIADEWGLRWVAVKTNELDDPDYVRNDLDRCYHCKRELMDVLVPLAETERATVVLGVNLDDLNDHRPGQKASAERGAVFPLVQAGLDKATVRNVSQALGLSTWDRPAAACLASRLPHGTPVTLGILDRVASCRVVPAAARIRRPEGPPLRRSRPNRATSRRPRSCGLHS